MDKSNTVLQVTWYRDEEGNLLRDIYGGGIEQTAIGGLVSQLSFDVHAKGALGQSSSEKQDTEPRDRPGEIVPISPTAASDKLVDASVTPVEDILDKEPAKESEAKEGNGAGDF